MIHLEYFGFVMKLKSISQVIRSGSCITGHSEILHDKTG